MPTFTLLASSTFLGANEDPLSEGGVWTKSATDDGGSFSRDNFGGNAVVGAVASDSCNQYTGVASPDDQYSRGKLTVNGTNGTGSGIGLHCRHSATVRTYYRFVIDHAASGNAQIYRNLAGTGATRDSWTEGAWTDDQEWTMTVEGSGTSTTIRIYKDSTLVRTFVDNDGSAINSGAFGIGYSSSETAASISYWEGGSYSSGSAAAGTTLTGFGRRLQGFIYS